jgi:hypothetical protein
VDKPEVYRLNLPRGGAARQLRHSQPEENLGVPRSYAGGGPGAYHTQAQPRKYRIHQAVPWHRR